MTTEEYIREMIDGGYRAEIDFSPIKCHMCESKNLEDFNEFYEEHWGRVEFQVRCKDCKQLLGTWAYGSWDI